MEHRPAWRARGGRRHMAMVDLDEAPAWLRELDEGKGEVKKNEGKSEVTFTCRSL